MLPPQKATEKLIQPLFQTETIHANGINFHIGMAGQGPRLLFLTGSNADLRKANSPLQSPLVNEYRVLTYDQRGMGQSDKPDAPYSMLDYAEDAIAIMDALDWHQAHVAGYSFGGMVAQEMAIRWPARVSRLALMATTAGGEGGASYPIHEFTELPPYEAARCSLEVANLQFTKAWQTENPEKANAIIEARMQSQIMFIDEPGAVSGTAAQLAARAQHDTYTRLHRITAETLVIAGNRDGQAPLAAQKAMAACIPQHTLKIIDGSHGMLWENPHAFEHIMRFMQN